MTVHIKLKTIVEGFAEDKDNAKQIRTKDLLPTINKKQKVILDFKNIKYATQSYIHALIGEALKKYGENVLNLLEFKNCSPQIKSVIELVVDYSLGGFPEKKDKKDSAT